MSDHVTDAELADWLDVVPRTVRDLVGRDFVVKVGRGRYDLKGSVRRYIASLRATAAGRTASGDIDLATERALFARQQRIAQEMRNATARGELVTVAQAEAAWSALIGVSREHLLAIPSRLRSVGLNQEVAEIVSEEIHSALAELAAVDVQTEDEGHV